MFSSTIASSSLVFCSALSQSCLKKKIKMKSQTAAPKLNKTEHRRAWNALSICVLYQKKVTNANGKTIVPSLPHYWKLLVKGGQEKKDNICSPTDTRGTDRRAVWNCLEMRPIPDFQLFFSDLCCSASVIASDIRCGI